MEEELDGVEVADTASKDKGREEVALFEVRTRRGREEGREGGTGLDRSVDVCAYRLKTNVLKISIVRSYL
ncbi:hypothetical protein QQS21_007950 [Conoideocrella luteorostrata]|uniref:Uncharacterized protein n=1 Tax=Conoideocrella luteorostrata TaxID=1105319 RepID=A0AAJ0CMI8_9HYPO|nr:hypothetical protein QQS21_007950 [Conoideocrella luteorostrata]